MEQTSQPAPRLLGVTLILVGVMLLLAVALVWVRSALFERSTRGSVSERPSPFERQVAERRHAARTGRIGRMVIPRIGLHAAVLEGVDREPLLLGVGHVPETAFPGEPDNSALAAHRDTHFSRLKAVRPGDRIRVDTSEGSFAYVVDSAFVVTPERTDLLRPTGRPMLTLVTCYPFHWVGPAPKRFIVRAHGIPEGSRSETVAASE